MVVFQTPRNAARSPPRADYPSVGSSALFAPDELGTVIPQFPDRPELVRRLAMRRSQCCAAGLPAVALHRGAIHMIARLVCPDGSEKCWPPRGALDGHQRPERIRDLVTTAACSTCGCPSMTSHESSDQRRDTPPAYPARRHHVGFHGVSDPLQMSLHQFEHLCPSGTSRWGAPSSGDLPLGESQAWSGGHGRVRCTAGRAAMPTQRHGRNEPTGMTYLAVSSHSDLR